MATADSNLPFQQLAPDEILNAVETLGYACDGHVTALNSYENRVYQIGLYDAQPVIAKFYRPARWTDDGIREEHAFTAELVEQEIPVISPLADAHGQTLFHNGAYRIALYPRIGGRAPELDDPEHLVQLGRCVARIHNTGSIKPFLHRPAININSYVTDSCDFLLGHDFIPADLTASYEALAHYLTTAIEACFARAGSYQVIRLHGDCHIGNILWHDDSPFMVDFDDARSGPAIQDLWMFLSGDRGYMNARLHDLLEGYTEFRSFDPRELHLIEALRTMRMIYFAGWLARRWHDPAFMQAFPWFNSQNYWENHILHLKEQLALMEEPPLEVQS